MTAGHPFWGPSQKWSWSKDIIKVAPKWNWKAAVLFGHLPWKARETSNVIWAVVWCLRYNISSILLACVLPPLASVWSKDIMKLAHHRPSFRFFGLQAQTRSVRYSLGLREGSPASPHGFWWDRRLNVVTMTGQCQPSMQSAFVQGHQVAFRSCLV